MGIQEIVDTNGLKPKNVLPLLREQAEKGNRGYIIRDLAELVDLVSVAEGEQARLPEPFEKCLSDGGVVYVNPDGGAGRITFNNNGTIR